MNLTTWSMAWSYYWLRLQVSRDNDDGEVSLTTVIMAFVLAGLAIAAGKIIYDKVTAKANSIKTE
jgi:hypothetical protein